MASKKSKKFTNAHTALTIRRSRMGEAFYPTGNGVLRYCVHIQEYAGQSGPISERYLAVANPSFGPAAVFSDPILFREAVSETGERFAYPHNLGDLETGQEDGTEREQNVFGRHLGFWNVIDHRVDGEDFYRVTGTLEEDSLPDCQDFAELLDAALAPDAIDHQDHPTNLRLTTFFNELVEEDDSHDYAADGE